MWWLSFVIVFVIGATFIGAATALGTIERRRRQSELRWREIPRMATWLKEHYPAATKDEVVVVVERVVRALAEAAHLEPAQLRPDDRLYGYVLPPIWRSGLNPVPSDRVRAFFASAGPMLTFDESCDVFCDSLVEILAERGPVAFAPWEKVNCWETVGDAIDFMAKRTCATAWKSAVEALP